MLRSWKAGVAMAALGAVAILGGGNSTAEAKGDLVVKRFLIGRLEPNTDRFIAIGGRGTQNVYRDCVVMLVFSRPIDMSHTVPGNAATPLVHVNDRTFRIGIPAGPGLFIQAEGSYYQYILKQFDPQAQTFVPKRAFRNRVFFDPTRRFDDPSVQTPYGFESNSLFAVEVPGLDTGETKTVRTPEGDYNARTFVTTFRTTAKYLQDYTQPRIVSIESNDAPGVPLDGRTSVDSKADVIAKFSEPMLPAAFDPSTTFTVTITSPGTPRLVSGVIRASPDGTAFTFRPVFGYGQGPATVRVNLAGTLTDRAGNVVDKGAVVNFTSEFDPNAQQYGEIVEEFDNPADSDWTSQATSDRASWNGWIGPPPTPQNNTNKNQGQLAGVFGAKSVDVTFSSTGGHGIPWWNAQSHTQNLYSSGQVGGTARSISDFKWRYYQATAAIAVSYPGTTVMMGHNTAGGLSTTFSGSFSDTPVTLFNNTTYSIPTSDIEWISGPKFTGTWSYNGKDGVVLDIATANGSGSSVNYWRYTPTGQGGTTMIRAYSGGAAQALSYNHDVRFLYLVDRSEAQSRWYDTLQNSVNWLDPIVIQSVPPGTVVNLVFQGALENPNSPGTPDITTLTPWSADPLEELGGNRFIRFHVDFTSNLSSSTKPTIEQIKIPFVFF